jgi:DNA-directed RNA polymerase subunit omega
VISVGQARRIVLHNAPETATFLSTMVIPLDLLEGFQGNVYEMTCAAMKRSIQINLAGDDELEANRGKIVSTALKQILTQKVRYRHPDA